MLFQLSRYLRIAGIMLFMGSVLSVRVMAQDTGLHRWVQHSTSDGPAVINVSGPLPMPRGYHSMAYDTESDRTVLFGGIHSVALWLWLNDTWSYDASSNTWTKMSPAKSPAAGEGPLVYDIQSDRMILFYGCNEEFSNTVSETWAYDFNSDTWTNMEPSLAPPALLGARMVYDIESDRMILFGGLDPTKLSEGEFYLNETWTYNYDTNTWTKMEPKLSPPGINYQPMAYDANTDRVIAIGSNSNTKTDKTWIYDYNTDTWEVRDFNGGPSYRDYGAMVYAEVLGQVILFGEGEPILKNDTWTYDFATHTWLELKPVKVPNGRGWHAMVYDTANEQIILFGGGTDRDHYTSETWIYDPRANNWAQVAP